MGKKRKQDQQADDLSSSNAKRCRSCQNGEIVRPSDRMPLDGSSDVFASIRDILIQFKDIIQVKVSLEEKLKRKIVKLEKKREKDKNKYKEDLSVLKEDLKKELKEEVTEELRLKIQEEMRKEGCTKVHHCSASASQRSQQQSQTTRFRLEIKSKVNKKVYKGKTIQTDDGDRIEVVMKDGVNLIASGHPLSSITVQLVVLYGEFKECNREFWFKEDFEKSIIKPRQGNPRLVKNGSFKLIDGSCVHEGAVITENSNRKDVVLGVMVGEYTEERVLEGVSNLFKVQEAKTENRDKRKESATGDIAEDKQPSYPIATMLNSSCLLTSHTEGNGQALNGNSQQYFPQVPMGISSHPTSTQATQNGSVSWRKQQSLPPPTVQTAYALTAANGNGPAGQLPLDRGQQEHISSSNASAYLETSYLNLPEDPSMSDHEEIQALVNQKLSSRENKTMTILSKDAPAEIPHPAHPEHKLKLVATGDAEFVCNGCHELGAGAKYTCPCRTCDFDLHKDCALAEATLVHPLLKDITFELRHEPPKSNSLCDGCGTRVRGFYYRCAKEDLDLHPCCAKLPITIQHEVFTFELRKGEDHWSIWGTCCGKRGSVAWFYRSTTYKTVYLHVRCVKEVVALKIRRPPGSSTSTDDDRLVRFVSVDDIRRRMELSGERAERICKLIATVMRIITAVIIGADPAAPPMIF